VTSAQARHIAAAAAFTALAGSVVLTLHAGFPNVARWRLFTALCVSWLLFLLAAWCLLRLPRRVAVPAAIAGGILLQVLAFTAAPQTTDDFYRYAWDGRVQAAGIDPYRYAPTDPALAGLRDPWLFPLHCRSQRPVCTRLNHPADRTIYPPVAEAYFLGVHALSPAGSRHKPLQLAAAALAILTSLALVVVLRGHGDPRQVVLWAWCPTVVLEAGNNAHVDVLGALLVVVALGLVSRRRAGAGGALLGLAVAVKLLPVLVGPAVLRRRGGTVVLAAVVAFLIGYLPHLLAVQSRVLGFLPGYLHQEGYGGSGRFALLRLVLPDTVAPYAAVAVLAVVAWVALRTSNPDAPWRSALLMVGAAFLVIGPSYPWYALLLVALVALAGRTEWLAVGAAAYPAYLVGALHLHHEPTQQAAYGAASIIVMGSAMLRSVAQRRRGEVPHAVGETHPGPEVHLGRRS